MRSIKNNHAKIISISVFIIFFTFLISVNVLSPLKSNIKSFIKQKITKDFLLGPETTSLPSSTLEPFETDFSIAFFSDSHVSTSNLGKAINEINRTNVKYVFGLGDYSNVGTDKELKASSDQINRLTSKFYILPGDHDLWNGRDKSTDPLSFFDQYFEKNPTSFKDGDIEFIFIDNSDLYNGVPGAELERIINTIQTSTSSTIIILSHKAIKHPLTIHTMGYIDDEQNELVYSQAERLDQVIKSVRNKNIYLVHGDLHSFGQYSVDNITSFGIGALTEDKNFQQPRYAIGVIDKSGKLHMQDRPISP
jgi:predicted phosphodiesterase